MHTYYYYQYPPSAIAASASSAPAPPPPAARRCRRVLLAGVVVLLLVLLLLPRPQSWPPLAARSGAAAKTTEGRRHGRTDRPQRRVFCAPASLCSAGGRALAGRGLQRKAGGCALWLACLCVGGWVVGGQ